MGPVQLASPWGQRASVRQPTPMHSIKQTPETSNRQLCSDPTHVVDPISIQYNLEPHPPKYIRSRRPPKYERRALRFDPAPATLALAKTFIIKKTSEPRPTPMYSSKGTQNWPTGSFLNRPQNPKKKCRKRVPETS